MTRFAHIISAVDAHTAGEPVRVVLSGIPAVVGETMAEKKQYMKEHLDHFRTLLMQEPRGHNDMFGAIIIPPTTGRAQYGILFMDNAGYLDMCGHSVIGVTTVLIEIGMIESNEPETSVVFDTPAGLIRSYAKVRGNRVSEVSVANVSSFLYAKDVELDLPGVGRVFSDVAFGGNFFATVDVKSLRVLLHPDSLPKLVYLGMEVKRAINEKIRVQHPTKEHINRVELVEIYERPDLSVPFSKSVVVFGNGQFDRCPCGTGTSATMAVLYGRGRLSLGTEFTAESIIGTRFRGKLVREVKVGDFIAVDPVVTGAAYITGIQQFVVDPSDPVKYGFRVDDM